MANKIKTSKLINNDIPDILKDLKQSNNDKPQDLKQKDKETTKNNEENSLDTPRLLEIAGVKTASKVFSLELQNLNLEELPNLSKFKNLRTLNLSANFIKTVAGLYNNKDIRELKMSDNQLKSVSGLENQTELNVLFLQHNYIEKIGEGLFKNRKLKELYVSNNRIESIKLQEVCSLTCLSVLDLEFNGLTDASCLASLLTLEEINLSHNSITLIPDFGRCKKLTDLNVSHNRISDISVLKNVHSLITLDVSDNILSQIEASNCPTLKALVVLNLSNNQIAQICPFDKNFPELEILDVSKNRLADIRTILLSFTKLKKLCELNLTANLFSLAESESSIKNAKDEPIDEECCVTHRNYTHAQVLGYLPNLQILDGITISNITSDISITHQSTPRSSICHSNTGMPSTPRIGPNINPAAPAPLMRPKTTASGLSLKSIENQIDHLKKATEMFETETENCFKAIRLNINKISQASLQYNNSQEMKNTKSLIDTKSESCNVPKLRRRLNEALNYAANDAETDEHVELTLDISNIDTMLKSEHDECTGNSNDEIIQNSEQKMESYNVNRINVDDEAK